MSNYAMSDEETAVLLASLADDEAVAKFMEAPQVLAAERLTIPEQDAKAVLTKLGLRFALSNEFIDNPETWNPLNSFGKPRKPYWAFVEGTFELRSPSINEFLGRDSNPSYRVGGFNESTYFPTNVRIVSATSGAEGVKDSNGNYKPLGIDWRDVNLVALLGTILSQFGYAEKVQGSNSYEFKPEFFEFVNNGVASLRQTLAEKLTNGDPLSENEKQNHPKLIGCYVAQKQLENLTELLKQFAVNNEEAVTYVVTIGRRKVKDKDANENYIKSFVHVATEGGQAALAGIIE